MACIFYNNIKCPLVSIVITVYNKEKFIRETLKSALNQTYSNIEIIMVNDGSTDRSLELIKHASMNEPRINIISQENAGAAAAKNRGLENSSGEFINILDGDDLLHPRFVERTVGFLIRHPESHIVHTSYNRIDGQGKTVSKSAAPHPNDYLKTLLLGNIFAPSAIMFRREVIEKTGLLALLEATDDWEYLARWVIKGMQFDRIPEFLASYRDVPGHMRQFNHHQGVRFFPAIEKIFEHEMAPKYSRLKDISVLRHRFFLMLDYLDWGWVELANEQFQIGITLLRGKKVDKPSDIQHLMGFIERFSFSQKVCLIKVILKNGWFHEAGNVLIKELKSIRLYNMMRTVARQIIGSIYVKVRSLLRQTDVRLRRIRRLTGYKDYEIRQPTTIDEIRQMTLDYVSSMRLTRGGAFIGYRHSSSTRKAVLYATLSALLLKHLYGVHDDQISEELEFVHRFQSDDGIFRDPVIECKTAETEDWWGWRHLTLHALMTLSLYNISASKEIRYIERFADKDSFCKYLSSRDWGANVCNTSNELQNVGVMLQYAHDHQDSSLADELMEILYEVIDKHQDSQTGLYGKQIGTPMELSSGVQTGYHFWLLYFYDKRPVCHIERIIDSVLKTQNVLGGYGVPWNSSACEDIDSIDPLVRLSRQTDYRFDNIQGSLKKAMPAILHNINGDGGWVFRRHEPLTIVHPQMFSGLNESNMFYTWFRTLGLAYCLSGLEDCPAEFKYEWNFRRAVGHQFF